MKKNLLSTATLNNGVEIPYLGLGTWLARGQTCEHAVEYALNHGYAHIDTAQEYGNEQQVGKGWKASAKTRDEVFLTTKVRNANQGYESTKKSFEKSLTALQTDYVDLMLIHWPNIKSFNRTLETWQALIELNEKGLCRSIGVSNFTIPLMEKLLSEFDVVPAVNQVEFHNFLYQKELLNYCRDKEIQLEAYSPIARAKYTDNPQLQRVAKKHHKTVPQVMLAWCLHHDVIVIPKSVNEGRIKENAAIFFELDDEDMKVLNNLGPKTRLVDGAWAPPNW